VKFTNGSKMTVKYVTEANKLKMKTNGRNNQRKGETKKERKINRYKVCVSILSRRHI
jgi:hypothetical protein